MLQLPDRGCKMFKLPNVDTKCSYYDTGVTKCLLRSICYEMCELRLWWQPYDVASIRVGLKPCGVLEQCRFFMSSVWFMFIKLYFVPFSFLEGIR